MEFIEYFTKLKSHCSHIEASWNDMNNEWRISVERNPRKGESEGERIFRVGKLLEVTLKSLYYEVAYPDLYKSEPEEVMVSNG